MADFLDYLAQLEAQGMPQPAASPTLPMASMAGALRMPPPDIRQQMPSALQIPGMADRVPEMAPQLTPAGVYGSGVGGFMRGAADFLRQNPISVRAGDFRYRSAGEGGPSRVDDENEALRSSASTLAKRRWAKAQESVRLARDKRKGMEKARPRAAKADAAETDYLPEWAVRALGDEAPQGVVPNERRGEFLTRARALMAGERAAAKPKATPKASPVVRPNTTLEGIARRAESDWGIGSDEHTSAAESVVRDMLKQAKTERDLSIIAAYVARYPDVAELVAEEYDEIEARIGAAR